MSYLTHRQKLIKLANCLESGWAVTDGYNVDVLAILLSFAGSQNPEAEIT